MHFQCRALSSGANIKFVVVDVAAEDARFKLPNGELLVPCVLNVMESAASARTEIFVLRYAGERSVKTHAAIISFLTGCNRGREIERQIRTARKRSATLWEQRRSSMSSGFAEHSATPASAPQHTDWPSDIQTRASRS